MSTTVNRKPTDDGSFAIIIPHFEPDGKTYRSQEEIRGVDNEIKIRSSYGLKGCEFEAKIRLMGQGVQAVSPKDPIFIMFDSMENSSMIAARVLTTKWIPPQHAGDTWSFYMQGVSESTWALRKNPIVSLKSEQLLDFHEILARAIGYAYQREDAKLHPALVKGGGKGTYYYNTLFMDGEQSLAEIIEDHADENELEWYCDPFKNAVYIGAPAGSSVIKGYGIGDAAINRIKGFSIGSVDFISFVFAGNKYLQVGKSFRFGGKKYKIVRSSYGERGNGYRESTGIAMVNDGICTSKLNSWLANIDVDERVFADKRNNMMFCDSELKKDDNDEIQNFYEKENSAKWRRKIDSSINQKLGKDPRGYDFQPGQQIENVLMSTPFAGDEVGIRFPALDGSRHVLMFPEGKLAFPVLGNMIWKKEDKIPTCEPKDLYLRMEKGSLYFDEAKKTWLVKSTLVKLEADAPDAVGTKPDPTTTTGTWIELEKDDHITIHLNDNDYIEVKSGNIIIKSNTVDIAGPSGSLLAKAGHTHTVTFPFTPVQLTPTPTVPCTCSASDSNTTKTKAE